MDDCKFTYTKASLGIRKYRLEMNYGICVEFLLFHVLSHHLQTVIYKKSHQTHYPDTLSLHHFDN